MLIDGCEDKIKTIKSVVLYYSFKYTFFKYVIEEFCKNKSGCGNS